MDSVNAFVKCIEDENQKHNLFIKREDDRHQAETDQIYDRFKQMIDYKKCVDMFVEWFKVMDEVCTQRNSFGHGVSLPRILPKEIMEKLKSLKLTHSCLISGEEIRTPHHWTVTEEKYPLLELKPELKLFCKVYKCEIHISKPMRVVWGN